MTKEELLQNERIFSATNGDVSYIPLHSLEKFFSQNVVIPKGNNRNPYADVLHEWLEDITKQIEGSYKSSNFWRPIDGFLSKEYRIKPSEPVYEWQWYKTVDGVVQVKNELGKNGRDQFFTEEETNGFGWTKFEETKRERKQQ